MDRAARVRHAAQGRVLHEARDRRGGRARRPQLLIDAQRQEYLQSLRELNELLAADGRGPAAELLLEGAILHLKADLEWLELIEQRLAAEEVATMTRVLEARKPGQDLRHGWARRCSPCAASTSASRRGEFVAISGPAAAASRRC